MAGIPVGRLRTLATQGAATAVTALLIGGAAAAVGQPLDEPTSAATESPTEGVTHDPTDGPTESVSDGPTEPVLDEPTEEIDEAVPKTTEDGDEGGNAHGKAVSKAARGLTPPVGNCRNHGHWVSTVAKGLDSCDDNPRPASAQLSKAPKPAKAAHAGTPAKIAKSAKAKAAKASPNARAKRTRP